MKLLVLSDSHIPYNTPNFPKQVLKEAKSCDLCLHAGDICEIEALNQLKKIIPVEAVQGNMDDQKLKNSLPTQKIINLEDITIGITHGRGSPGEIISTVNNIFKEELTRLKIIIFGHSHQPLNEFIKDKLYFNPGSSTDKIFAPYNSYGIISIKNGKILERRIVKIG